MATEIKKLSKETRRIEQNWWYVYLKANDCSDEERRTVERLYGFDEGSLGESESEEHDG